MRATPVTLIAHSTCGTFILTVWYRSNATCIIFAKQENSLLIYLDLATVVTALLFTHNIPPPPKIHTHTHTHTHIPPILCFPDLRMELFPS